MSEGMLTREEANRLLFGQAGHAHRGMENVMLALGADAIVVLHTDGTYEVTKDRDVGLGFGMAVREPTVLYLKRDGVRVLSTVTGRVRLASPCVREVSRETADGR